MINQILIALVIIPLAITYIVKWSGLVDQFKIWLFYKVYSRKTQYTFWRIKPFDCAMCLSFHSVWLWEVLSIQSFSFISTALPFAAAGIATILNRV
jgi:hypothetical protein